MREEEEGGTEGVREEERDRGEEGRVSAACRGRLLVLEDDEANRETETESSTTHPRPPVTSSVCPLI